VHWLKQIVWRRYCSCGSASENRSCCRLFSAACVKRPLEEHGGSALRELHHPLKCVLFMSFHTNVNTYPASYIIS
jgi:hypothetical protein